MSPPLRRLLQWPLSIALVSHDLQPTSTASSAIAGAQEPEYCPYCRAPLSAFYYFCLACGTPYKSLASVITPARPRSLSDEELVRLKTPQVATLFWTYLAVIIGVGLSTFILFREDRPDLHLFINEIAILMTTCAFGWFYRRSLLVQLQNIGFDQPAAYVALAALVPLLLLNYGYHAFFIKVLHAHGADSFDKLRDAGVTDGSLIVTFCLFPAILEEIAYRGLMQHWLQTAIAPWKALVVASFLFAATHLAILSLPYLFLVGLLLGWTKQRTGSLYPSMLIHFLHNFVVIEFFALG